MNTCNNPTNKISNPLYTATFFIKLIKLAIA